MKHLTAQVCNMVQAIKKVLTTPRKIYDCNGTFLKTASDTKLFDQWLSNACKSNNFYEEVITKYKLYVRK